MKKTFFTNSNKYDLLRVLIVILLVILLSFLIPEVFNILISLNIVDNITQFNSIFAGLLGFILTILALLYTFESQLKENKAIKILIERNKFKEIYDIFTDSSISIFFVLMFLMLIPVFQDVNQIKDFFINLIGFNFSIFMLNTFLMYILLFASIRTFRCFYVFKLLQDAIKNNEK